MNLKTNIVKYAALSLAMALSLPSLVYAASPNPENTVSILASTLASQANEASNTQVNNQASNNDLLDKIKLKDSDSAWLDKLNLSADFSKSKEESEEVKEEIEVSLKSVEEQKDDYESYISYTIHIKGTGLPTTYDISAFALKDSVIKDLSFQSINADGNVSFADKIKDVVKELHSYDYVGRRLCASMQNNLALDIKLNQADVSESGDATIYLLISKKENDKTIKEIKAIRAKAIKDEIGSVTILDENKEDDTYKENIHENSQLTEKNKVKYLVNDTNEDKDISAYMDTYFDANTYYLLQSFIRPDEMDSEPCALASLQDFKVPKNSAVKLELKDKQEAQKSVLSNLNLGLTDNSPSNPTSRENKDVTNPLLASLVSGDKKSSNDGKMPITNPKKDPKLANELKAKTDELKKTMDKDMVASQTRSVAQVGPSLSVEEAGSLADQIEAIDLQIRELIFQAGLYYELNNIEKLEKEDKNAADEEYEKIAMLVADAKITSARSKEVSKNLVEASLKKSDSPLVSQGPVVAGQKTAIYNMDKFDNINVIHDLTKDSPNKDEQSFSEDLNGKLENALKKVQTVTIGKERSAEAAEEGKVFDPFKLNDKKELEKTQKSYQFLIKLLNNRTRMLKMN